MGMMKHLIKMRPRFKEDIILPAQPHCEHAWATVDDAPIPSSPRFGPRATSSNASGLLGIVATMASPSSPRPRQAPRSVFCFKNE